MTVHAATALASRTLQRFSVLALAALLTGLAAASGLPAQIPGTERYVPSVETWERRTPEQAGMNAEMLAEALAMVNEVQTPTDLLEQHIRSFGREPVGEAIGPFKERGPTSGLVIRGGYIVAEWGDPHRVDPTFSVTKSFLSSTVGLAYDRSLIRDLDDPVRGYFAPVVALRGPPGPGEEPMAPLPGAQYAAFEVIEPFESEHNRRITWDHLLRQTSDWQGTLWGKPDWADRPRGDLTDWQNRERHEPGSFYMYNDVRVNLLALAALNVWRQPLPQVLKEHLMDPIGASGTWRWLGYDNSWVVLDGSLVQSVSGGAHWGGGMWINTYDMARFGLLTLNRGRWGDQQILSEEWVNMALTPTPVREGYGFMNWFLRDGPFTHNGAGPNIIYVDPDHDLVVVTRWAGNWNAVVQRIVAAIEAGPADDG